MIKALIFDFDNVIGLSEKPRFDILQKTAKKYNIQILDSDFNHKVGRTSKVFLKTILKPQDAKFIDNIVNDYKTELKSNITSYIKPNKIIVDFIYQYKGQCKLGIASMSSHAEIEKLLKHYNIDNKFEMIVSREDVIQHKPDPEIYMIAAQRLGLTPLACAVVEDTVVGAQAALAAQMKCYVLLNGLNQKEAFTDLSISGFITSQKDLENIR